MDASDGTRALSLKPVFTAQEADAGLAAGALMAPAEVRPATRPKRHVGDLALKPMSARERLFVDEYLIDLNGTLAAGRAGYHLPGGTAFRLLRRPHVAAAIQAAMAARGARTGVTADRVVAELAAVAFTRLDQVMDWGERDGESYVEARPASHLGPSAAAAIADIKLIGGSVRVRLHDKIEALSLLARHMGMLVDRLEVSRDEGVTLTQIVRGLSEVPEDIRDRMQELLLESRARARGVEIGPRDLD
ncbi:MAG: hypothetical protein JWP35_3150 [Caulobacter sp.]|nr:hypothetical protein [Caulobacter sp.]